METGGTLGTPFFLQLFCLFHCYATVFKRYFLFKSPTKCNLFGQQDPHNVNIVNLGFLFFGFLARNGNLEIESSSRRKILNMQDLLYVIQCDWLVNCHTMDNGQG